MKNLRNAAIGAVAALTLLFAGATSATAAATLTGSGEAPPTVEDLEQLDESTVLMGEVPDSEADGIGTAVKVGANPAGCTGSTNDPHKSGIYASVHGNTSCPVTVSNGSVATTLYRHDWWGLNYMADQTTIKSTSWVGKISATPHSSCDYAPSRTYSGYSGHTVTIRGVLYSANTSNTNTFRCDY